MNVKIKISALQMHRLYDSFLKSVANHGWHRTVVKRSLTRQLVELITDDIGPGAAKSFLLHHPYEKETYFRHITQRLADKYEYLHYQLVALTSAIIARIAYDTGGVYK
jgi:hypothetical protein